MNRRPKPRIRKGTNGVWECIGGSPLCRLLIGLGHTPTDAYLEWLWRWLCIPYPLRGGAP